MNNKIKCIQQIDINNGKCVNYVEINAIQK